MYFVIEVLDKLSYEQIDQLLISYENNLEESAPDGSSYYLLCNLNPVKTACNILFLADLIGQRYPIASLRTEAISETFIGSCKTVLDKLFLPRQMKYQLR